MLYRTPFPRTMFSDLDRMQRELQQVFGFPSTIRGAGWGGFPALNIGHTSDAVEIYAFVPGIPPDALDINVERGVLVIAGERKPESSSSDEKSTRHISERFTGRFRRVVSLPDDIDPDRIEARCQDGVLRIRIQRRQVAQPRKITVQ